MYSIQPSLFWHLNQSGSLAVIRFLLAVCLLALVACGEHHVSKSNVNTTLIINAQIVDGSGEPAYSGALRFNGELITEIGNLRQLIGETVIDAGGLTLTPGFIDTHSHHDRGLDTNKDAIPILTQGITTSVFGQDGVHSYPIADFFAAYEQSPAAVNVTSYVGHNTIRDLVMGRQSPQAASKDEVESMASLLADELASGALGFSSGLEYVPGKFSEVSEIIHLAQTAADVGARYASHVRSEDRFVFEAIEELIHIGRVTDMPVHYSHMKLAAKQVWGEAGRAIEMLNAARNEGIEVTADIYPYEYWQSTIGVLLPSRDPDDMEEIKFVLESIAPADGIIFTYFAPDPSYVGLSIADIAVLRRTSEAQTLSDVIRESIEWTEENGGLGSESIMGRSMQENDIAQLIQWGFANICSDGGFAGHPRGYGAFPRVLAKYVREQDALPLETAIAAMTQRAANAIGIKDRGLLAAGMKADLVLFDPNTVQDHATIQDTQKLSTGIISVWVNGQQVLKDGEATGARPGRALKRIGF